MALTNLFILSDPQFPHLKNGDKANMQGQD
jgi:hypothetical protein